MLERTLTVAKELLRSPSKAAARFRMPDAALPEAAVIYFSYLIVTVLFYSWKPANFPPIGDSPAWIHSAAQREAQGVWFWLKGQSWGPLLTVVWAVFLAWFCRLLKSKTKLFFLVLAAFTAGFLPLAAMAMYYKGALTRLSFTAFWIAMFALMAPWIRDRDLAGWKRLVSLLMAMNVVNLVMTPIFFAAVALRWAQGYLLFEYVMIGWGLLLGSKLLSELEDIPTPRAFIALFVSALTLMLFVFSLYLLRLVSKEVLTAMFPV